MVGFLGEQVGVRFGVENLNFGPVDINEIFERLLDFLFIIGLNKNLAREFLLHGDYRNDADFLLDVGVLVLCQESCLVEDSIDQIVLFSLLALKHIGFRITISWNQCFNFSSSHGFLLIVSVDFFFVSSLESFQIIGSSCSSFVKFF